MTQCAECRVSVMDRPLYRVNAKGEPGVFLCEVCMASSPDPAVKRIVDAMGRVKR